MNKLSIKREPITPNSLISEIDSNIYWGIRRIRADFPLSSYERQAILSICRHILENEFDPSKVTLLNTKQPAIILVSLYKKNKILGCAFEPAKTFIESLMSSTFKTIKLAKHKHSFNPNEVHFRINILFNKTIIDNVNISSIKKNFMLGIDSISMQTRHCFSILKNSMPINHGYSYETTLSELVKKCGIDYSSIYSKKTTLSKYSTIEFREDYLNSENKHGLYDLYRGRQIILQSEITTDAIMASLSLIYSSLKKFLSCSEGIAYEYNINKKKWHFSNDPHANLRKIASLWICIEVAKFYNDQPGVVMAKHVLAILCNKHYHTNNEIGFLELNGLVDIGTSAFLLLALNAINPYQPEIFQLFKFIYRSYDKKNKKLIPIIKPAMKNTNVPHKSEYYLPGIGLKALSDLNDVSLKPFAYDLLIQTLPYYRKLFHQARDGIKMVPWLTSAYTNVFLNNGDMSLAIFIYEMNDKILHGQITSASNKIDLIGSFSSIGSALTTAAATESLINAYKVADASGHETRKASYKKAILMAIRFILQAQIKPDETDDINSIGGFKNNFFDNNIRIDTLQHCVNAILQTIKLFL